MSDAFREIEEEVRQQRLFTLWRQYGNYVLGAVLLVVVITGAVSAYDYLQQQKRLNDTHAFYSLVSDESFPDNIDMTSLDVASGVKALLLLKAAGAAYEGGNVDQAIELYNGVVAMDDDAQPYYGLAVLMLARLDADGADDMLMNLAADEQSIWRGQAMLELAAGYGVNGDYDKAVKTLSELSSLSGVPSVVANKASALEHVYNMQMNP